MPPNTNEETTVLPAEGVTCFDPTVKYSPFPPGGTVFGSCKEGWEPVKAAFAENFADGRELGAQLCIMQGTEVVVDLYGTGLSKEEPFTDPPDSYSPETIQPIFSSGKNVEVVVMAILVDRGLVKYEDSISKHWPAFGQNGKQDITIADLMRHSAGMAYFIDPTDPDPANPEKFTLLTLDDVQDRQAMHRVMEEAPPQRYGSTKRMYHGITRGLVVDGILKHVDGRTIGEFAFQEIFRPLGIEEGYFVSFDRDGHKHLSCGLNRLLPPMYSICHEVGPALLGLGNPIIARMVGLGGPQSIVTRTGWGFDQTSFGMKDPTTGLGRADFMNVNPQARKAEVTSAMCLANARSMTKMMAPFCNGGQVDGVRLFSEETARIALAQVVTESDDSMMATFGWSQGGLCDVGSGRDTESKYGPKEFCKGFWGWGGWGGSINFVQPDAKVTISYAMTAMGNQMLGDERTDKIMMAVAKVIGNDNK